MKYSEQLLKTIVGKNIKYFRKNQNLTQEMLASKIGVEPKTLSKIETGKTFISASLLSKLINYFEISPCEFLKYRNSKTENQPKEKIEEIIEILKTVDKNTLDIIYKIINSLNT